VAGTNYIIKVRHEDSASVFLAKIAKPLPHTGRNPFLLSVKESTIDGKLEYFE